MDDDIELLRRYAGDGSEAAFAELVRRRLGFVYHTALRYLDGDSHSAEDVAQTVFNDLARKAGSVARLPALAGWLYTGTRYAALQRRRAARRRQLHEREAHTMQMLIQDQEPAADWERLRPVVDEALHSLNRRDREAVLLRFFEGRDYPDVGMKLNLSADGARSCVERALDRMHAHLAQKGMNSSTAALGLALATQAGLAAPVGLAGTVAGAAMTAAVATGSGTALALGALPFMKLTTVLLAGSLVANAVLGTLAVQEVAPAVAVAASRPERPAGSPPPARIYSPDPTVFAASLRTAGISDRVRRALIEADIDAQFRAREEALLPSKAAVGWWQWQDDRLPMQTGLALLDLRREKAKLRLQLLGPDPDDPAAEGAENAVAPEKRAMLRLIGEDYSTMLASLRFSGPLLPIEREQLQFLEEQRKKDLAALLTPEELAAYEDRTWIDLPSVQERLRFAHASDAEFALVKSSFNQLWDQVRAAGGRMSPADEEAEDERIRQVVGDVRFEELERAKRPEFRELQNLLVRSGRPAADGVPVYEQWKKIELESHRLNARTDLTQPQKMEELRQLAGRTREAIVGQLGPELAGAYLKRASWIQQVERGSVVTFTPGGMSSFAVGSPLIRPSSRVLRNP